MHWLIGALVSPALLSAAMQPFYITRGQPRPFFIKFAPLSL